MPVPNSVSPVSRVVWPRDGRPGAAGPNLRRAAFVQAAVLALVGVVLRLRWGHAAVALVAWGLAVLVLATGLFRPAWFRPLHRFGALLGRIVGTALTWILLAPLYVLGFGLAAAWLRLRGADPMQRRLLPAGFSYWVRRRRDTAADDYTKQFRVEDVGARAERRPLGDGGGVA